MWALAGAVAALVLAGQAGAAAQTVIVRNTPPGSPVELVVNGTAVGMGSADLAGFATLPFELAFPSGRSESLAYVYVDRCDALWRVLLVEGAGQPPPPEAGCVRREIPGLFVLRRVSTLVVNVGGSVPTLTLRQGSVNLARLDVPLSAPTGLVLSGDAGFGNFSRSRSVACGSAPECAGRLFRGAVAAGAGYWFTPSLGVEAAFVRPGRATIDGAGQGYSFDSSVDAQLVTLVAKAGGAAGRARIYGLGGMSRHEAVSRTTQTIEPLTVTVDDIPVRILEGGTQTYDMKTRGWGWLAGGGVEAWLSPHVALYVEGSMAKLQGRALGGGEGELDDRLLFVRVGARFRIGR